MFVTQHRVALSCLRLVLILVLCAVGSQDAWASQPSGMRTWTEAASKRTIVAEFVEIHEGKVRLKRDDGRVVEVATDQLSAADQAYAKEASETPDHVVPDKPAPGPGTSDSATTRRTIVTGYGATEEESRRDAFRRAVEQCVGVLVDATLRASNDELIEEVLTYSGGYIKRYETLTRKKQGDLYVTKISAEVEINKLAERFHRSGVKTARVDGSSLAATIVTQRDMEKSGGEVVKKALGDFPLQFCEFAPTGKFEPNKDGGVEAKIRYSIDQKKYNQFVDGLQEVLRRVSLQSGTTAFGINGVLADKLVYEPEFVNPKSRLMIEMDRDPAKYLVILATRRAKLPTREREYRVTEGLIARWYLLSQETGRPFRDAFDRSRSVEVLFVARTKSGQDVPLPSCRIFQHPIVCEELRAVAKPNGVTLPGGPAGDRIERKVWIDLSDARNTYEKWIELGRPSDWGGNNGNQRVYVVLPAFVMTNRMTDSFEFSKHLDLSVEEVENLSELSVQATMPAEEGK